MKLIMIASTALALSGFSNLAQAQQWVASQGRSCEETCKLRGGAISGTYAGLPRASGQFQKGQGAGAKFHVCRTSAEGRRPGWNLNFSPWREQCFVGFGGKESGNTSFECLCEPVPAIN